MYFFTNILYDNDIGALSKIQSLWLSYNSLTGTIPSSFGTNNGTFYILKIMNVNNALTSIPIKKSLYLGSLSKVTNIHLNYNSLTGTIPAFGSRNIIENIVYIFVSC